jgi:sulfide:quinone oxidoreductase
MNQHEVLIVGGGNAGISLAARLTRDGVSGVAVVEGQPVHRYRPLLNYVGAGEAGMSSLERAMGDLIPSGCTWIRDEVESVDPAGGTVTTRDGQTLRWSTLVLCPGVEEDWESVPGLREAYDDGWAGSTFVPDSAPHVWDALKTLRRGSVVFTIPPEPAPCGATALKPLLMACDHWRREGVLQDIEVRLVTPFSGVVGMPSPDETLVTVLASYGVEVLEKSRVARLDGVTRTVAIDAWGGAHARGRHLRARRPAVPRSALDRCKRAGHRCAERSRRHRSGDPAPRPARVDLGDRRCRCGGNPPFRWGSATTG